MKPAYMVAVARHLSHTSACDASASDGELLDRYHRDSDQAAIAELVARHERTVLAACRQVLSGQADIEDAFQATFVVLVRQSGRLGRDRCLGAWLFAVAHRIAVRLVRAERRRARREAVPRPARTPADPGAELSWREAVAVLHEELDTLPDRFRLPLVLFHLDGLGREEIAARLGWRLGSVKDALERGRERMRAALHRRGVGLSVAALAAVVSQGATAAPAPELSAAALRAAAGEVPVPVLELARSVMPWAPAKATVLLAPAFVLLGGVIWATSPAEPPEKAETRVPAAPVPQPAAIRDGAIMVARSRPLGGAIAEMFDTQGKAVGDVPFGELDEMAWPRFSPDGKWVAVMRVVPPRPLGGASMVDVFVSAVGAKGPPAAPLVAGLRVPAMFAWAADSKALYVSAVPEDEQVRAESGKVLPLKTRKYDLADGRSKLIDALDGHGVCEASADGKLLLTEVLTWGPGGLGGADRHVLRRADHVVPLATLKPTALGTEWFPSKRLSPDGSRMVGIRLRTLGAKEPGLFIVDLAKKTEARMKLAKDLDGATVISACWSPTGSRLLIGVAGLKESSVRVAAVDADGTNPRTIADYKTMVALGGLDWQRGTSAGGAGPEDADRRDRKKFESRWSIESVETGGADETASPAAVLKECRYTFQGDKYLLKRGNQTVEEGAFRIDPTKTPAAFDLKSGNANELVPGIYEFDGETLKLCFPTSGKDRPTEFKGGNGNALLVLKRTR
jgi:RNA polymerase sigma factor (sigma-70 family)